MDNQPAATAGRFALTRVVLSALGAICGVQSASSAEPVDYAREIQPIFAAHCIQCHGPREEEGGLRLDQRQRALAGGVSGPVVIVPGHSAASLLWQFVTGRNDDHVIMPPKNRGQRLSEQQCELVRRWIDEGAPWPDTESATPPTIAPKSGPSSSPPATTADDCERQAPRALWRARLRHPWRPACRG